MNVESLKGLSINNLGEFILLQLGLKALDDKTQLEFKHEQKAGALPKYADLIKFVQHKCSVLDMAQDNASNKVTFANRKSLVTTMIMVPLLGNCPSIRQTFLINKRLFSNVQSAMGLAIALLHVQSSYKWIHPIGLKR